MDDLTTKSQALATIPETSTSLTGPTGAQQAESSFVTPQAAAGAPQNPTEVATDGHVPTPTIWDMLHPFYWRPSRPLFASPFGIFDDLFFDLPPLLVHHEPSWFGWPPSPLTRFPEWNFRLREDFDTWLSGVTQAFDTMIGSRFGPGSTWASRLRPDEPEVLERSFDENGVKGRMRAERGVFEMPSEQGGGQGVYRSYQMYCEEGTAPTMSHSSATGTDQAAAPSKWEITSVEEVDNDKLADSNVPAEGTARPRLWAFEGVEEPEDNFWNRARTALSHRSPMAITDGTPTTDVGSASKQNIPQSTADTVGSDQGRKQTIRSVQ